MSFLSRRHVLLGITAISVSLALAACGTDSKSQETAENLAKALTNLDISGVQFFETSAETAQNDLAQKTAHLAGAEPEVTVTDVSDSGDSATVRLHWSWKISGAGQNWEYDTELTLSKDGQNWLPQWTPAIIHPQVIDSKGLLFKSDAASRGEILGQDDALIVGLRPVVRVGISKENLADEKVQEKSARALAEILEIDADTFVKQVKNGGENQFVEAIVLRQAAFKKLDKNKLETIKGFLSIDTSRPLAPTASFAPDILGSVSEANADDIAQSNGTLSTGQYIGHGGLQERFDEQLRGTDGYGIYLVDLQTNGKLASNEGLIAENQKFAGAERTNGSSLKITLNSPAQQEAVKILDEQDSPSAIVALKVSTGEILIAANGKASEGFSTALLAQYAPGCLPSRSLPR